MHCLFWLIFKRLFQPRKTVLLQLTKMQAFRYISSLICCSLLCIATSNIQAQNCPPNIDFESGSFNGWTCYTGSVASVSNSNVMTFNYQGNAVFNRQTMYSYNPGNGLDEYGNFPKNCPNGSGHSIKLGNDQAGTEAEAISYDFTIPANANTYNLIYNYAVVFQDPGHLPSEQPRMEIEIRNLTTGDLIYCSSFTFFANGSPLPGFELSPIVRDNTPIWFKRWSAVSINLDNLAGNNIRLLFKTADCTFRRHFGYAYIDVNTGCSDKFVGANFCPDDVAVFVTAPFGYQTYTWWDSAFTQVLGNNQTLAFVPPPPAGTTVAVVLVPYNGYGCLDTLYTALTDTLSYNAEAGPDLTSCNERIVQLGVAPKPDWFYNWNPPDGLNNTAIANPLANPDTTTTYVLSVMHNGGGCRTTDTVIVKTVTLDNALEVTGKTSWCIGSGDSTILTVLPADSIQWHRNGLPIASATQTQYQVTQSGVYHALVFSSAGCVLATDPTEVSITSIPEAAFTVNNPNQCLQNNRFIFTNNSTNAVGNMEYLWNMGDGFTATSRNLTYSYKVPGTYKVLLLVRSSSACFDSASFTITVYPNVAASFAVEPVCINLPVLPQNNTIDPGNTAVHYLWDFGNGNTSILRNPPPQVYAVAGNYVMSLTVSTDQCPTPKSIQKRFVYVDAPRPGKNNPAQIGVINLPLTLQARRIGDEALWMPATNLDNPRSYTPVFTGEKEQTYSIELKTKSGCITIDTQVVKLAKDVSIYVPNSFTPNNDGRNDVLRPVMYGIKELYFFRVYNRWGQLVFETSDATKGWDGRQRSAPAEMQTLVWMLEALGADNNVYKAKGTTVLMR